MPNGDDMPKIIKVLQEAGFEFDCGHTCRGTRDENQDLSLLQPIPLQLILQGRRDVLNVTMSASL